MAAFQVSTYGRFWVSPEAMSRSKVDLNNLINVVVIGGALFGKCYRSHDNAYPGEAPPSMP